MQLQKEPCWEAMEVTRVMSTRHPLHTEATNETAIPLTEAKVHQHYEAVRMKTQMQYNMK